MSGFLLDTNVLSEVLKKRPTAEVLDRIDEVLADLESRGLKIGTEDVLIAATALVHDLTVVSRNLRHFQRVPGLSAESWWS